MGPWRSPCCITLSAVLSFAGAATAQQQQPAGSIRGVITDGDFGRPLPGASVQVVEQDGARTTTGSQGEFVLPGLPSGRYTLVVSKEGYVRQVRVDVPVAAGQLTDADLALSGDFYDLEEFIVQDLQLEAGSELALLELRFESPSFMNAISADFMSRAGASDAASALNLVSGATVQDGKFAVIRGLPDRYVSSQLNGIRLPSADEDKRAVELDQFPAVVIESLQISKTFTPDQQGDASGGAVDVRLRGIPEEDAFFRISAQLSHNTQVGRRSDFLTYHGGGVNKWGKDDGRRDIQHGNMGGKWDGAVGVTRDDSPQDYKWSMSFGGRRELRDDLKVGGFASVFYERASEFHDNGISDSYWVESAGGPLVPATHQGASSHSSFKTSLFDVTESSQSVQWGGLAGLGIEGERNSVSLRYLYSHTAEDKVTLAEDTRGKAHFFPGYDPNDPDAEGHSKANNERAPYLRTETLVYTERTTEALQLSGASRLPLDGMRLGAFSFGEPEIDWSVSRSKARFHQPDKRQFGSWWRPEFEEPGIPFVIDPFTVPAEHFDFKPSENFTMGNVQRSYKTIEEESDQYAIDLKLPFEQWDEEKGYLKFGVFNDDVKRSFDQESFSNFGAQGLGYKGGFNDFWSDVFPSQDHSITAYEGDIDYRGELNVSAWYGMLDLPLMSGLNLIGGVRFESTKINIVNEAEDVATWWPKGSLAGVKLNPGDADVSFSQSDALPSIGLVAKPSEKVTLRAAYSRTVARQTFKEITPMQQQEYMGGPVFIGNRELEMSSLRNYDLRLDYTPQPDSLFSVAWFRKLIKDPIEYVLNFTPFTHTRPVNYPEGKLSGYEFEVRQGLGVFDEDLSGISVGANATFIESRVRLPDDEVETLKHPNVQAPIRTRDMMNAPERLYNLYVTQDIESTGTQVSLFYTVKGDTLVVGAAAEKNNFVPSIYAKEYGTLNLSVSQKLGEHATLQFQAKNLTNPRIEQVYRSEYIGSDVRASSYTKGRQYSLGLSGRF